MKIKEVIPPVEKYSAEMTESEVKILCAVLGKTNGSGKNYSLIYGMYETLSTAIKDNYDRDSVAGMTKIL